MTQDNETFEDKLKQLNDIVNNLENGKLSLEKSIEEFKKGIKISKELEKTLTEAEDTVTKIIDNQDEEKLFNSKDGDE